MHQISTLYFIYGIEDFQAEKIRRLETEFSEELQWLKQFEVEPDDEVVKALFQKVQAITEEYEQ